MRQVPPKFTHITRLDKITNVEDILIELTNHEQVMVGTDIEKLIYFSRTYIITNRNIHLALEEGYFTNPQLIEQLQMHFAHIYFNTLNNYAQTGQMSHQWQLSTKRRLIHIQPAGLSLLLAIRAHILSDAVIALNRLFSDPKKISSDYFRVESILLKSSREIVHNYNPNPRLWLIRELVRKIVIVPVSYGIFRWRHVAWRHYEHSYYTAPDRD